MKLELNIPDKLLAKLMNSARAQGKLLQEFIIEVLDNTYDDTKEKSKRKENKK